MAGATYPVYCTGVSSIPSSSGATFYVVSDTELDNSASSAANAATTYYTAGTLSHLSCGVFLNTMAIGPCTFESYIGGSVGNQAVSVTSSATGVFTDVTSGHTDSISATTTVAMRVDNSDATGTTTCNFLGYLFTPSSGGCKRIGAGNNDVNLSTASQTEYYPLAGTSVRSTTELNTEIILYVNGNLQNGSVNASANTRTTATTFKSRIGTAGTQSNGNLSISIPGSGTFAAGVFTDRYSITSHQDALANTGNTVNFVYTTSTGTGTLVINSTQVDVVTTDSTSTVVSALGAVEAFPATTKYLPYAGGMADLETTEAYAQIDALATFNISRVAINVTANTVAATSTLQLRIGAANANNAASISASTAGFYSDASSVDSVTVGSLVNYALIKGSSGTFSFVSMSAVLSQPSSVTFQPDEDYFFLAYPPSDSSVISLWQ